jgi:hypothetical protein
MVNVMGRADVGRPIGNPSSMTMASRKGVHRLVLAGSRMNLVRDPIGDGRCR